MLKELGGRYKKLKAKNDAFKESIKQKDEDIKGLVACVGDVDEEIELYEESIIKAEVSASTLKTNIEPPAPSLVNPKGPTDAEP
ncbi:hypothetical protein TIFTF001_028616 [Ficus carica]|uniref:Uncharacterized protein n=1 Tax=Ficus carica TaxID=3494 RepID=A0AA88DQA4_FICCA|nr:hypothetical protein TIFTF001_028616 [Ficus carica]